MTAVPSILTALLAEQGRAVLPIIDYELPENIEESTAWFTMPVASNLRVALIDAPLAEIVRAVAVLARELAALAAEGTHHRDVKPENLYERGGRYLLGDFGLVKRLEDEDLTRPEERLPGPGHYLPNEAILRWEDADPEAIDLVCLAKTLWVLMMRERRPIHGQLRADDYYSMAKRFDDEPYVNELDLIVERATSNDPAERGTLTHFADELFAWLEAREMRQGMLSQAQRDEEVVVQVRRYIVELGRTDSELGLNMFNISPDTEPPFKGITSMEFGEALQYLSDRGEIHGERDDRPGPANFWMNVRPAAPLIDDVETQDAVRAELVPILCALSEAPPDLVQIDRGSEVELGGVTYAASLLAFGVRYWIDTGFVEADEQYAGSGVLFVNVRVNAAGSDYLRGLAMPRHRPLTTAADVRSSLAALVTTGALQEFHGASRTRFNQVGMERLEGETPSRYAHGLFEATYAIEEMVRIELPRLKEMIAQAQQPIDKPMWAVRPENPFPPIIKDGVIERFMADPTGGSGYHSQFWRASPSLLLYLVRGFLEDSLERAEPGSALDLSEPVILAGEALLHAHRLATLTGAEEAGVRLALRWTGLAGRQLLLLQGQRRWLEERYTHEAVIETQVHTTADTIPEQLVELVKELTKPLYVTFDFFEPPHDLFEAELEPLRRPMPLH